MPVSYIDRGNIENFIIPAPLVSISKNYDTTGDGNVIGTRYTITLTGILTADKGSPTNTGIFYNSSTDTPYNPGLDPEGWYRSIQKKQKALSNLFSRENEGGELHLMPPEDPQSQQGLRCFPRIVSVDFPEQTGGSPNLCNYTITLEADRLVGYATDKDGHQAATGDFGFLVQSADENWSITENEGNSQLQVLGTGATGVDHLRDHLDYRYVASTYKTYILTHTFSATGKRRFDESTGAAGDLAVDGSMVGMTADVVYDGEAWQQARGYVLNKVSNTAIGTRTGGYQTENGVAGTWKTGFISIDGISLPSSYKGYDYKRVQSIDKTAGSFSITETWLLLDSTVSGLEGLHAGNDDSAAPLFDVSENPVIETMEVTQSSNSADGIITVDINGNIEGLARQEDWELYTLKTHADPTQTLQTNMNKYKYEQAVRRLKYLSPFLYQIAHQAVAAGGTSPAVQLADSPVFTNTSLNPIPASKSIVRNPTQGTINYSLSFDNRPTTCIPGALTETITVEDSHPHHIFSETPVIGRRRGPVFQDINTQSAWRRSLTIEVQVSGILHGCNWSTAMRGKPSEVISINGDANYNQQHAIRTIIDTISPVGIVGVDKAWVGPSDPTETWDPISGKYTYRLEWTYDMFEGAGTRPLALGHSYLGSLVFQYPRTVNNIDAGLGTTPPGTPW